MIIDSSKLLFFFTASWILIITPGPDLIYVITRGASQGKQAGVISAAGVTTGILVHTVFAVFGISVLLKTSATAFIVVKTIGAAYLAFIGIKTLLSKNTLTLKDKPKVLSSWSLFVQGACSNIFNPKVALFFMAFLPQFVDSSRNHVSLQMLILGLIFAVSGLMFLILVGYFGGALGVVLWKRPAISKSIRLISGSVLIGLGIRLAISSRPPN